MKKYNVFFFLIFFCGPFIKAGVDQKLSYQGWSQALGNIFSAGKNSCLGPSRLNSNLRKQLRENNSFELEVSAQTYEAGLEKPVPSFIRVYNKENQKSYLVFAPAHDVAPDRQIKNPILGVRAGNFPLYEALSILFDTCKKEKNVTTAFIPLILTWRKHWVLLEVRIDPKQKKVDVNLIDSKGPQALVFSIEHLKKVFSDSSFGGTGFSIRWKNYQLGHQGLFNQTDCGYFMTEYLLRLLYGESVNTFKKQKITVKKRR